MRASTSSIYDSGAFKGEEVVSSDDDLRFTLPLGDGGGIGFGQAKTYKTSAVGENP